MPDSKITTLTALTAADPAVDMFPVVDVSDTTMAASGTTKRISINNILACSPAATLASATITGDLTVDTNVFKVDTTSNQVGIGTASPSYAADISIASVDGLRVKNTLATSAYFNRFHISNNTGINFIGYGASFSGGTILGLGAGSNSIFSDAAAPFGIATTVNQPLVFGINGSTAMTLNSTGLGVGVASPAQKVDVNGAVLATNVYLRSDDSDVSWGAGVGSRPIIRGNQTNNTIKFYTASTDRMTLDASGNLLVGTTGAAGGRLDVQTATGDCSARVKSNAAGSNATFVIDYVDSYGTHIIRKSGTDVWLSGVIADTGATPNYKIQNASAVGVQLVSGATAWTTLSDETMKDIIEPISNAVAKVGSLRSVIGKFKTDDSNKRRSFLIAQDVQSVLPEAVDVVGENNELGLRYTEVIPLLVAAIKELTAEVNALKNA